MTGVWQAAAVPCCNRNKIYRWVVRKPSKLSQEEKLRSQIQCCICFLMTMQDIYLYYKWLLPILQDTCTWKCPPHHNMFLRYCMLPHHIGCHLQRTQSILIACASLMLHKFKQPNRACLLHFWKCWTYESGRFFLSIHFYIHRRSHWPSLGKFLHCGKGFYCSH